MLDAETKRRIDTCRDILVGKVPDPKSQVEQITIALIYKFMDDMDREAEGLGGQRSFFAGDFAQYGWARLKAPELSGKDKLDLYADAIGRMNENPGIPALFRDIFKNAYLPYRDPETLRAFLKEIDGFTYDHSERLGDAFEYLLSVLGSQGDAGQFRTPRHIIDFMVEVIDPQKHESILDPACGTAGFLISAWKHILLQNTTGAHAANPSPTLPLSGEGASSSPLTRGDRGGLTARPGDRLTPDERQNLAANIRGYDISPDMVRLSLVNLYLHGFTDPHIVEYDTLTSEERWNETADVILANPPFMSPKGGIKPHKRFSVQATRSEVLFVDYMAEHLSPNGRAAIVVPEGIIFQSGTAYKKLREMLVKNSLIAVVSLPAGVFNPYSGVKTSILILDRRRAKTCDSVLFVKVENDGFGLGAQRRAVTGSDLPEAKRLLEAFFAAPEAFENSASAHKVTRAKIGNNGEWNLSGERYVETNSPLQNAFPLVPIENVVERITDSMNPATSTGQVIYIGLENIESNTGRLVGNVQCEFSEIKSLKSKFSVGDVLYGKLRPNLNKVHLSNTTGICSTDIYVLRVKPGTDPRFLSEIMRTAQFNDEVLKGLGGAQLPRVGFEYLKNLTIPLPPLTIQEEIVAEIEGYQKIIDGARQVVENYQPRINVQPDWPTTTLSDVCDHITDGDHQPPPKTEKGVPFVTITNIDTNNRLSFDKTFFVAESYFENLALTKRARKGDVLYTVTGSFGIPVLINFERRFCFQRHIALLRPNSKILPEFLYCSLASPDIAHQAERAATGVAQKTVSLGSLRSFLISLPPLETQRAIVAEIEAEQALVEANKQLIARFEAKIKAVIDRVWGGDTSAPAVPPSA